MSRIHTITHPHGVQRLDLIHVRGIWKPNGPGKWSIGMGSEYEDFTIDPVEGAALEAAWLAFHDDHTPRQPAAVAGLAEGWAIYHLDDESTAIVNLSRRMRCSARGSDPVTVATDSGNSYVDADVVIALIAAHRHRVGGAS